MIDYSHDHHVASQVPRIVSVGALCLLLIRELASNVSPDLIRDFDDRWWTAAKKVQDSAHFKSRLAQKQPIQTRLLSEQQQTPHLAAACPIEGEHAWTSQLPLSSAAAPASCNSAKPVYRIMSQSAASWQGKHQVCLQLQQLEGAQQHPCKSLLQACRQHSLANCCATPCAVCGRCSGPICSILIALFVAVCSG